MAKLLACGLQKHLGPKVRRGCICFQTRANLPQLNSTKTKLFKNQVNQRRKMRSLHLLRTGGFPTWTTSSCKPISQGVGSSDERLANTETLRGKHHYQKCFRRKQNHNSLKGSEQSQQTIFLGRMGSHQLSQPRLTSSQGTAPIILCEKRTRKTLFLANGSYWTWKVQIRSKGNPIISCENIRHTRLWPPKLMGEAF